MLKPSSGLFRSAVLALAAVSAVAGCGGSNGGGLFNSNPSSTNNIATIQLGFPVAPDRAGANGGAGVYALLVKAYDSGGHLITVPYNQNIVLQSNDQCEVAFGFYTKTVQSLNRHAAGASAIPHAVPAQATPTPVPTATPTTAPTTAPSPPAASLAWNDPTLSIGVVFTPNPGCFGPNPVTLTASAIGARSGTITF